MINVEIKPTPGFDRETGAKVGAEARRLWTGVEVPPLFSSFSYEALAAAKEAAPAIPRGWLVPQFAEADWGRLEALDAASLNTNHKHMTPELVRELHARGYKVMLYTINDADVAQKWLDAGADGIFTDNLREFSARFPNLI
jgi:glycerophosphoryl diester phosphodiesterase